MSKRKRKEERSAAARAPEPQPLRDLPRVVAWIAVALVVAFAVVVRLRLLDLPLERDEGEYAYAGQLMLRGIAPYALVYNMKFPGTYAAYALIMALFGQTAHAIRIGLILVTSATTILVYVLGARLVNRAAGVCAAAAYTLLALILGAQAIYAHATHFVVLPAVGALVLLSSRRWPLAAGVLLGLAVLMKQPGAAFALFAVLWLLVERRFRDAALTVAGGAIAGSATAVWLKIAGVFDKFWFWTIRYAREYASVTTWSDARRYFAQSMHDIIDYAPLLWLTIAIGLALMFVERSTRRAAVFVVCYIVASFAAAAAGLYFRPHYFILTFPAVAMAAGGGVVAAMRLLPHGLRLAPAIAYTIVLIAGVAHQSDVFFRITPDSLTRALNGDSPFVEAPAIGDYIRAHTAPDDRVVIFGSEPEIYFHAQRKSATGYIYMYPLMEAQPFAKRMQREMMAEVDRANPKVIVIVQVEYSWLQRPDSDRAIFDYSERKVNSGYRLEGIIDEVPSGTVYAWGADAARYQPRSRGVIMVFRK